MTLRDFRTLRDTKTLCDTNILSELVRPKPHPNVLAWADATPRLAVSVITVDEIRFGLSWRPNPRISEWFDGFFDRHCDILDITPAIARLSGHLRGRLRGSGQTREQGDMLIAATAKIHGLPLVTRNVRDFDGCGIDVLDPFRG